MESNNRRNDDVKFLAGVRETAWLLQHVFQSHSGAMMRCDWSTACARAFRSMLIAGRGTILFRRLEEHFVSKKLKIWDAQLKLYILKIVIACIFKLKLRSIGVERRFAQSVCPMVLNI